MRESSLSTFNDFYDYIERERRRKRECTVESENEREIKKLVIVFRNTRTKGRLYPYYILYYRLLQSRLSLREASSRTHARWYDKDERCIKERERERERRRRNKRVPYLKKSLEKHIVTYDVPEKDE